MNKRVICALFALLVIEAGGNGIVSGVSGNGRQNEGMNGSSGSLPVRPAGDSGRGQGLYDSSCIVCHGPQAAGGIGPRLAGNSVLSNEQAFWKVVYEGRHVMPPLKGAITEQQMADIQAWLKTLR